MKALLLMNSNGDSRRVANQGVGRRALLKNLGFAISSLHMGLVPVLTKANALPGANKQKIAGSSSLFYKPTTTGPLWDAWLYFRDGTFYLYHLSGPFGKWDSVALATSRDGVHWKDHGKVIKAAPGVVWLGSGAVWSIGEDSGGGEKFIMNFSEWRGSESGGRQTIFFAESKDLVYWNRLDRKYEFRQDTRWYEPEGRWDNIWPITRPGGGFYGYWAATPKRGIGLGFGESLDGITWKALEPPIVHGTSLIPGTSTASIEVGAVHEWRGKYYAMVGLNDLGATINEDFSGPFRPGLTTIIADSPFGPFYPAPKNRRLIVGNASYFSRFIETSHGMLVNHHSWAVDVTQFFGVDSEHAHTAPLKRAVWDEEGTLRLMWWEKNNLAKGERLPVSSPKSLSDSRPTLLETSFDPNRILILEGVMPLPGSKDAVPTGLYLQGTGDAGTAFLVQENGVVDYGSMRIDGTRFERQDRVDRDLPLKDSARFRLIRKGRLTEFYLNDYLMQCYSLPEQGTGRVALIGASHRFRHLSAWYCVSGTAPY